MPRYFFEFYNDRTVKFDETGSECADRSEIEQTAKQRLLGFLGQHSGKPTPFCIAVFAACGTVVMTATGIAPDELREFWR